MAQTQARPQDLTGARRQQLATKHQEAVRAREKEIGMAQAVARELDDSVTDLVKKEPAPEKNDKGEVVYVEPPAKTVRLNTTIENMTLGIGNTLSFEAGKMYRVSARVAKHLEELGFIWH